MDRQGLVFCLTCWTLAAACGGESASPDAMVDAPLPDVGDVDVAATEEDARLDAVADSAAPCEDRSGYYTMSGACGVGMNAETWSAGMCIRQRDCRATLNFYGVPIVGSISGTMVSAQSTPPGTVTRISGTFSDGGVSLSLDEEGYPLCLLSGRRVGVADSRRMCCDVFEQDCPEMSDRCTWVTADRDNYRVAACVPRTAETVATDNAPCRIRGETATSLGRDNCAVGYFCSDVGRSPEDLPVCRRFCNTRSQCPAGEACRRFSSVPSAGLCSPTCTYFADACPRGTHCGLNRTLLGEGRSTYHAFCVRDGAGAEGAPCNGDQDCVAGTLCIVEGGMTDSFCRTQCNNSHPCADPARRCSLLRDVDASLEIGFCH